MSNAILTEYKTTPSDTNIKPKTRRRTIRCDAMDNSHSTMLRYKGNGNKLDTMAMGTESQCGANRNQYCSQAQQTNHKNQNVKYLELKVHMVAIKQRAHKKLPAQTLSIGVFFSSLMFMMGPSKGLQKGCVHDIIYSYQPKDKGT